MISFLSPAKSLDFTPQHNGAGTQPFFLEQAALVNATMRKKSAKKLMELQGISANLAQLNAERNKQWEEEHRDDNSKQAVLAFTGDVYQGLQASAWDEGDMQFANEHLRILSGLYGILKPSDLIQPYRLEMGTSLKIGRKANLYAFWEKQVGTYLKDFLAEETILNLASQEYFKAVSVCKPKNRVIEVEFLEFHKGQFKIISFFAKKARGLMANYIVRNRIDAPEKLIAFDVEGYAYHAPSSTDNKLVFHRHQKD